MTIKKDTSLTEVTNGYCYALARKFSADLQKRCTINAPKVRAELFVYQNDVQGKLVALDGSSAIWLSAGFFATRGEVRVITSVEFVREPTSRLFAPMTTASDIVSATVEAICAPLNIP